MPRRSESWESELELRRGEAVCMPKTVSVVITKECQNKGEEWGNLGKRDHYARCRDLGMELKQYMSRHFEGYTKHDARGCWVDDDGHEVCEEVEVVESAHRCLNDEEGRLFLAKVLEIGRDMGESMMFVKSDNAYTVSPKMYRYYQYVQKRGGKE